MSTMVIRGVERAVVSSSSGWGCTRRAVCIPFQLCVHRVWGRGLRADLALLHSKFKANLCLTRFGLI